MAKKLYSMDEVVVAQLLDTPMKKILDVGFPKSSMAHVWLKLRASCAWGYFGVKRTLSSRAEGLRGLFSTPRTLFFPHWHEKGFDSAWDDSQCTPHRFGHTEKLDNPNKSHGLVDKRLHKTSCFVVIPFKNRLFGSISVAIFAPPSAIPLW